MSIGVIIAIVAAVGLLVYKLTRKSKTKEAKASDPKYNDYPAGRPKDQPEGEDQDQGQHHGPA